jgi:hypothetical protein
MIVANSLLYITIAIRFAVVGFPVSQAPKKRKPGPKGPGEKEKREGGFNCGVTLNDLAGSCRQPPYHFTILEAVL